MGIIINDLEDLKEYINKYSSNRLIYKNIEHKLYLYSNKKKNKMDIQAEIKWI
jgi:hypothetical protein